MQCSDFSLYGKYIWITTQFSFIFVMQSKSGCLDFIIAYKFSFGFKSVEIHDQSKQIIFLYVGYFIMSFGTWHDAESYSKICLAFLVNFFLFATIFLHYVSMCFCTHSLNCKQNSQYDHKWSIPKTYSFAAV